MSRVITDQPTPDEPGNPDQPTPDEPGNPDQPTPDEPGNPDQPTPDEPGNPDQSKMLITQQSTKITYLIQVIIVNLIKEF